MKQTERVDIGWDDLCTTQYRFVRLGKGLSD